MASATLMCSCFPPLPGRNVVPRSADSDEGESGSTTRRLASSPPSSPMRAWLEEEEEEENDEDEAADEAGGEGYPSVVSLIGPSSSIECIGHAAQLALTCDRVRSDVGRGGGGKNAVVDQGCAYTDKG